MPPDAASPTRGSPGEAHDQTTRAAAGGRAAPGAGPFGRWRAAWRRHGYILPSIAAATLVFAWFVTWGDWTFLTPEPFSTFYDAHARGILEGRLDVHSDELAAENFVFEGRQYGYFGSAPSLLRIPLHLLFGRYEVVGGVANRSWSRPFMTAAFALGLAYAYGFLIRARRVAFPGEPREATIPTGHKLVYSLVILTAGLGTSALFMGSRAFVFHEATLLATDPVSDTRGYAEVIVGWDSAPSRHVMS